MSFALNAKISKTYHPMQEHIVQQFALSLLDNPFKFRESLKGATGSAIMEISCGYKPKDIKDSFGSRCANFGLAVSGGFWIDYLPYFLFFGGTLGGFRGQECLEACGEGGAFQVLYRHHHSQVDLYSKIYPVT
ncbi:uncharacterized protein EI90DRAFT_469008 [Cantharellus anzutake]|uniref:uncharacterized protein n=1 Tax=Cantharellus anzutake TaxID=1750568 RepID=UPI00190788B8|nr:uncharacterized protein EI90DRAFT_469008 [Cantharellus anzutake]KAF8314338.1 hypothetical protein EI90DRAFT_469008 [Cantharellus anzutake]